jgi:hypothetical protein
MYFLKLFNTVKQGNLKKTINETADFRIAGKIGSCSAE